MTLGLPVSIVSVAEFFNQSELSFIINNHDRREVDAVEGGVFYDGV